MTESNDQPFVDSTTPDYEPDADEAMSRNGGVAKVISTRTGLLDLPPEIRLMIFRHLLVRQTSLPDFLSFAKPVPDLRVLRTSKLIHQEASDVFYKENMFGRQFWYTSSPFTGFVFYKENMFGRQFWYTSSPFTGFPRMAHTIQNIETNMALDATSLDSMESRRDVAVFAELMQIFGNHSIIRHNLIVVVDIYIDPSLRALKWLIGELGRSTNFRTVILELRDNGFCFPDNDFPGWCEHLKTALEPVLGIAEEFGKMGLPGWAPCVINLRFHPVDHQNQSRKPDGWLSRRDSE